MGAGLALTLSHMYGRFTQRNWVEHKKYEAGTAGTLFI